MWTFHLCATLLCRTSFATSIKLHQYFSFQLPKLSRLSTGKYHLLPASQFLCNYWELLHWNSVLPPRMKAWPGITVPWNRLAVYLSAPLCNLPGSNSYTPFNICSFNTPDMSSFLFWGFCINEDRCSNSLHWLHSSAEVQLKTTPWFTLLQAKPQCL